MTTQRKALNEGRLRRQRARTAFTHVRAGLRIPIVSAPAGAARSDKRRYLHSRMWMHGLLVVLTCWMIGSAQVGLPRDHATVAVHSSEERVYVAGEVLQVPITRVAAPMRGPQANIPAAITPRESRPAVVVDMMRTTHLLSADETLGTVADSYNISLETLLAVNGLLGGDALMVGQPLRIPYLSGIIHRVEANEQLNDIAQRYAVSATAILSFGPNRLEGERLLREGMELFVPNAVIALPEEIVATFGGYEQLRARTAEPAGVIRAAQTNIREGPSTEHQKVAQFDAGRQVAVIARYNDWLKIRLGTTTGWIRNDLLVIDPQTIAAAPESTDFPPPPPRWVWPAQGRITSRFGPRWGSFHDGLDIANRAWTPIMAARTGVVREAGWCRGYGYCVKIAHDGGVRTVYGHLIDTPVVRVGEEVTAGSVIGYMGSTYDRAGGGYSTGVHLHFSVFINGRAIDPLRVLP